MNRVSPRPVTPLRWIRCRLGTAILRVLELTDEASSGAYHPRGRRRVSCATEHRRMFAGNEGWVSATPRGGVTPVVRCSSRLTLRSAPAGGRGRLHGWQTRDMTTFSLDPLDATDLPFVCEMLYEAAFWRAASDRPPLDAALREPGLARYVEGWGRPGDDGLVARIDGRPVGAVWVRRFDDETHGYGYLDERTPELSIAVTEEHRGRGIGRCLVAAMLVQLRLLGHHQVSLSVEIDNPARQLYESLGFTSRQSTEGAVTMVCPLS